MNRLATLAGIAALAAASAGSLAVPASFAQPASALPTPDFIRAAAQTDEFERQEGRLAAARAVRPKVKAFGRMMVRDHTKTTAELKMAIRKAHMPVPPPPPLSGDQMRMIDSLKATRGADFDRTYLMQQIDTHQKALGVMRGYASGGADRPIREAATKTVPIIEHHLMVAQMLRDHS